MSTFSDDTHHVAEMIVQGVVQHEPAALCNQTVLDALTCWEQRKQPIVPEPERFHLDQTRSFTISYDGKADHYWPDEAGNFLGESLVREFLFDNGICSLDTHACRLYVVSYKVLAMIDVEYLLVCPYPTTSGNIAGAVVVCVNQHLNH